MTNNTTQIQARPFRTRIFAAFTALIIAAGLIAVTPAQPAEARVSPPKNCAGYVALTFDDGPSSVNTPKVLDILKSYGVPATFFPNGWRVAQTHAVVRRISAEGHTLGSHNWGHYQMTSTTTAQVVADLERSYAESIKAGAQPIRLYRPPYGSSNDKIRAATAAAGWTETRWTVDPQDYNNSWTYIRDHVVKHSRAGSNILLHDGTGNAPATIKALPGIIEGIWAKGLCFGVLATHTADGRRAPISGVVVPPGPKQVDSGKTLCPEGKTCDSVAFQDYNGQFHLWKKATTPSVGKTYYYGKSGDYAFTGDWDCDGIETLGLYRRSDGFVYLRNSHTSGVADISFYFGRPGDIPIAGDWDDDGCDTVSVYRPSNQTFYIINKLGKNGEGLGNAEFSFVFGNYGDVPFAGDFDGDGRDTVGLHRPSTGLVYYSNKLVGGWAEHSFIYGRPGDHILAGDWNGDGRDTVAVWRPSEGVLYLRNSNTAGNADAWTTAPGIGVAGVVKIQDKAAK